MTNRVQPDPNPASNLQNRAAPSRGSAVDALFAHAMASISASFAPPSVPSISSLPKPAAPIVSNARRAEKKQREKAESRQDDVARAGDRRGAEPGVVAVGAPLTAAQAARQELRRASDSGARHALSSPADDPIADSDDSTPRETSQPARSTREPGPSSTSGRSSGDQSDSGRHDGSRPSDGSAGGPAQALAGADTRSGTQTPQSGSAPSSVPAAGTGTVNAPASNVASGAGSSSSSSNSGPSAIKAEAAAIAKPDPIAALGALGSRPSRVRLIEESTPTQNTSRQASLPDQVSRGLATLLRHQGGSVTLRLTPESLGQIKINLKIEEGHVWATFEPSSDASRDAITHSLASLRTSLESRGLVVERLDLASPLQKFDPARLDPSHDPLPQARPDSGLAGNADSGSSGSADHQREQFDQSFGAGGVDSMSSDDGPDSEPTPDIRAHDAGILQDSPIQPGMARRLRLDAVA